ncbi:MAG: hypothetical protein R3C05_00300 [Pirellulaceae bacterium]
MKQIVRCGPRWVYMLCHMAVFVALINSAVAQVDPSDAATETQAAEDEIRTQLGRYVAAFNERKFDPLADLLAPDFVYRDDSEGVQLDGAASLVTRLKQTVDNEPTLRLWAEIDGIAFQNPSSATARGTTLLKAEDASDEASQFVVSLSKSDSGWKLRSIIEETSDAASQTTAIEAIESLGWLVGTWRDDSAEKIVSKIEYLPGRRFLRRTFMESSADAELGMEIIGYDPVLNRVRSWTYFSDGSFGTGYWRGAVDHWSLTMVQTLSDGRIATGKYLIEPKSEDTMIVKLMSREVAGEMLPSGSTVTMTRLTQDSDSQPNAEQK